MAAGRIERAWEVGQELLALRPEDRTLLADLARLGEWTGNGPRALGLWKQLLAGADDPALREHAWRLSLQMFDFDSAIELLAPIGAQRQMTDEELDALVYSHETRGTPEEGEAWLRGYVQRYPKQRLAWQRLQQILEHTQQLQEETGVWARMARHFPLSVKERMQWAETHWNLFDPRQAWKVLAGVDTRAIREPEFWRLRAALAWALEQDDDARAAYERMLALDIRLNSSDEDQLIALYRDSNPKQALQVLIGSWQRSRDPRRLASALQLAENLHDWPALKSLLAEAEGLPGAGQPLLLGGQGAAGGTGRPWRRRRASVPGSPGAFPRREPGARTPALVLHRPWPSRQPGAPVGAVAWPGAAGQHAVAAVRQRQPAARA